jgi:microcystin-dependent protein
MDKIDAKFTKITNGILDAVYPVGAIYLSTVNTSPATLFGGTWTQIKDRFLLSAGDTYNVGNTGGSATKNIGVNNLPGHSHGLNSHVHSLNRHTHTVSAEGDAFNGGSAGRYVRTWAGSANGSGWNVFAADSSPSSCTGVLKLSTTTGEASGNTGTASGSTGSTGGGEALNIMPPYLTVYMWKRTA